MNLWFTSDTHFGHARIIEYCKRPFKSLEHMDRELIRRWNERVKEDDMVIFLGDFCFRNSNTERGEGAKHKWQFYREQLNGEIVFVQGNHDGNNSLNTHIKSLIVELGKEEVFCCHKPEDVDGKHRLNFVGHVHEKWKVKRFKKGYKAVNVGVDAWNFYPVSYEELIKALNDKNICL